MNKVTLPREVAEAIESIRAQGFENCHIVRAVTHSKPPYDDIDLETLIPFAHTNFDDLLLALAAGYEVEKTPEEAVKEYFEYHLNRNTKVAYRSIQHTLNLLGIKIEGVNA